ncbi:LLM class flavin-dependent oxidoreductase [Tsukamurella paurometabola]|uniref:F420-dependent glucose-6-phosphate dehydrogenase n=1 Tax=Tsukamurella paurometabola TaxID=2061 RepID=A0A3P8JXZ6_TSUPA|nr:LLM class flavin-dependent oxidoreductase [Tsukamurella paurometabola]MBS4099859.1 LLM class flavin-dependent oxidoreductase [Tsukamurella paurometabola]UEA81214.1 LLM class flavin-dependent oxidoreductase [Tsukamurella paurometabola]VDR38189.1 F420-dependent glucose-6-phosphate dehydrogenase [Tsukamurella paurometabola]
MKISLSVTNPSFPDGALPGLARVAALADAAAFDTLWVADHLLQVDPTAPPGDQDHLEAYTTLGHLAARTERIRLGAMVSPATFRPPAVLVAAVTTLALLSEGRAWLGLGAGHHGAEATDMGLPFPGARERLDATEDTLRLAHRVWSGDDGPFRGTTVRCDRPRLSPLPATRPPILVGGAGEKRTLRMVARYADACNVFDMPDEGATVRRKLAVLAGHCRDAGRAPSDIETTLSTRLGPTETAADLAARARTAAGWGIDHLVLGVSRPWTAEAVEVAAAAAKEVADVPSAPWHTA